VIKAEYYFGMGIRLLFLTIGLVIVGISLFVDQIMVSACLGVFGFASLWSIHEWIISTSKTFSNVFKYLLGSGSHLHQAQLNENLSA